MKILVAESMSPAALDLLRRQPGFDVIESNPKDYEQHLGECEALLVRSAVKVKAETLAKAPKLRVIGRAGVGVDNVDLAAATAAGVLVMNTPGGNAVSVAEHTLALMLALARMIPEANSSTRAGKWEKKKFLGSELRGKTLGIVGLGNIGQEVVRRALAFEMRVLAADPYVNPATAAGLGVELLPFDQLIAQSDYISLHVALTPETRHMINAQSIARMKPGVRIINCARGELVDQDALAEALVSGKVAGAGLDVFSPEPLPPGHPLLSAPNLIATPHIAGSTEEAQEIVGLRIVEQLIEYLLHGIAINAVNMPAVAPEQYRAVSPYIELAERLGRFAAFIAPDNPQAVRLTYRGRIAELNTNLLRNAALAGVLSRSLAARANLVNALQLASQRNLTVSEAHQPRGGATDSIQVEIIAPSSATAVTGGIVMDKPRLLSIDGIPVEITLAGHLIYMRNIDVPGVIGHVGSVLGQNQINIANFSLGRQEAPAQPGRPLEAVALVEVDTPVSEAILAQLRSHPAVRLAVTVDPGA